MRGLRTRESQGFEAFFALVQAAAAEENAVFFLDCGEGNAFAAELLEGEDISGWLIPLDGAAQFEEVWREEGDLEPWLEFVRFAFWGGDPRNIRITFQKF